MIMQTSSELKDLAERMSARLALVYKQGGSGITSQAKHTRNISVTLQRLLTEQLELPQGQVCHLEVE